jgi:2-oxoglutarate ferredoxin oxidoreductase subunit beta
MSARNYIRDKLFPTILCSGCGHGIVMGSLVRAVENLEIDKNDIVAVSGIGCSSRICEYLDFHTLHAIHGRAIVCGTIVKFCRPELKVLVAIGDGDACAIGGNHLIHAARRNIDITVIIMNNNIYGMTGGQYSPLTGYGDLATTTPYGNIDGSFDIVKLMMGAGASFVARTTTYHVASMIKIIEKAMSHKGFAVVEVFSQCPTYYGRKNKLGSAVDMLNYYKNRTTPIGSKKKEKNPELIERGIFVQKEMREYCEEYEKVIRIASQER